MKKLHSVFRVFGVVILLAAGLRSQNLAEKLYEEGRALLNESRWSEAVVKFSQAVEQGGSRDDAALYWKAYALEKQGLPSETLETLRELSRLHPQSRWLKDAKALELKARRGAGLPVEPEQQEDEDLKLIAINSLMHTNSEKAVPLLENVLRGDSSPRLKKKALFVLTQSGSPKAREIVAAMARDDSNPEMQKAAIQHLGIAGSAEDRAILGEIYASTTNVDVKKRILQSFMAAGEKQRILAAAETEKDPELRREAVMLLGAMSAREDLWKLYQRQSDTETKKRVINALFVAGDHERMAALAEKEESAELRMEAIEKLGLMGRQSEAQLKALYKQSDNAEVKEAVLKAFFLQDNPEALIEVARGESNSDLKKRAVRHLSHMNSKVATDFMLELLNR